MEIMCLHPVIILNKSHHVNKVYRSKDWIFVLRGNVVLSVPSPKKAKITHDDIDSCYYLNVNSGEMIPMYLEVPCQKCIICKDKKGNEWATRITCEGNYHVNCPWWITLTYNNYNKPKDGSINKRDLQLFFKRLRERVSRIVGEDVRIRFVGVGEYGGNTARPHYHAEVFGLPLTSAKDTLALIENAWSHRISQERFLEIVREKGNFAKDYTFIREDVNGKPLYYLRNGFCYVKPAHDNTPKYLAKYMFKPEFNTPFGCHPNFMLCSRKNGIGYQYIQDNMQYHRNNPEVTQLEFRNKHTNKLCKFAIPSYFKDYWFPTPSKIVPNEAKKTFEDIRKIQSLFFEVEQQLADNDVVLFHDVRDMIDELNTKFEFWRPIKIAKDPTGADTLKLDYLENFTFKAFEGKYKYIEVFGFKHRIKAYRTVYDCTYVEYLSACFYKLYRILANYHSALITLEFDKSYLSELLKLRDVYRGSVSQYMQSQPQMNVKEKVYLLEKRWNKLKNKDMY